MADLKQTERNIETIRYYERIGIMPKPPRTEGDAGFTGKNT